MDTSILDVATNKAKGTEAMSEHTDASDERELLMGDTWSARRARHKTEEKTLMGRYFANHDFLVNDDAQTDPLARTMVASILVNQGTTPSVVVEETLGWIKRQAWTPDVTWYTPGSLVPGTLRSVRLSDPGLRSATRVFLFPGRIDPETEAVCGPETLKFVEQLKRRFTCALLSAHSIDLAEGDIYFNYSEEVPLQRACARMYAAHKFLFFDTSKFRSEGDPSFSVRDLLETAEAVTIYTVSAGRTADAIREKQFEALCSSLLDVQSADKSYAGKTLRLRIIERDGETELRRQAQGVLKPMRNPEGGR
jgi:hypothetical protein